MADVDDLARFVSEVFKHASVGNNVSIRSFYEGAGPFRFDVVELDTTLQPLVERVRTLAGAAKLAGKVVVCPPTVTFKPSEGGANRAREEDVAEGLVLSVECDNNPGAALTRLSELLGPPTMVVESGGITAAAEAKLHLYWRLNEPTDCREEHLRLKQARALATAIVGGDASNVPLSHPIRWPGTWHCKGEPQLAKIVELNAGAEIDLSEALETLRAVAPSPAATAPPAASAAAGGAIRAEQAPSPREKAELITAIQSGEDLHGPLVSLSAQLISAGMLPGFVVKHMRAIMDAGNAPRDERWQARYDDIPRIVRSAEEKFAGETPGEPIDLWARKEPPSLPTGLLPHVIEQFATVRSVMMGADAGGIAMAALTVCAATIPDFIKLRPKANEPNWAESPRMWTALVGLPSSKKSPIISRAVAYAQKLDSALSAGYVVAKREYEMLSKADKPKARRPKHIRTCIRNATIEATQEILADTNAGVLEIRDELSEWVGAHEKYGGKGAGADRGFYLQSFNGGPMSIDRKTSGHISIPNLSINMLGGVQPEVIRKIVADAQEDGLIQRFFPIVLRPGELDCDEPRDDVDGPYERLVEQLFHLRTPALGRGGNLDFGAPGIAGQDFILSFDPAAQKLQRESAKWRDSLEKDLETINRKLSAHVGKYDGMFARLCVVWHCIEHAGGTLPTQVNEATARSVERFMKEFLLPHAQCFYSEVLGLSDRHDALLATAGYILAHTKEEMSARDVKRGDSTMQALEYPEAHKILEQLEYFNWLEPKEGPRNSKARHWSVNPLVHKRFAERGRAEAQRRASVRETIAKLSGGSAATIGDVTQLPKDTPPTAAANAAHP